MLSKLSLAAAGAAVALGAWTGVAVAEGGSPGGRTAPPPPSPAVVHGPAASLFDQPAAPGTSPTERAPDTTDSVTERATEATTAPSTAVTPPTTEAPEAPETTATVGVSGPDGAEPADSPDHAAAPTGEDAHAAPAQAPEVDHGDQPGAGDQPATTVPPTTAVTPTTAPADGSGGDSADQGGGSDG